MRHLSPEQLIDLAEGTRSESSAPHLGQCDACRRQLAETRAMIATAAEVAVPEPSPLFWDHFSARVHEAIAAAPAPRRFGWLDARARPRLALPLWAGAAAAIVLVALLATRLGAPHVPVASPDVSALGDIAMFDPSGEDGSATALDDLSLGLMADLASVEAWNDAAGGGLDTHASVADQAVHGLTDGERRELQRLLRDEMRVGG